MMEMAGGMMQMARLSDPPNPPGQPPTAPDPDAPIPMEEPPAPIPVPRQDPPPEPLRAHGHRGPLWFAAISKDVDADLRRHDGDCWPGSEPIRSWYYCVRSA
jgi:hypothetical protein